MNKLVKIGMVALTAVGFSGTTVTANAATWHKGLPKFIQNKKFKTKIKSHTGVWAQATKTRLFMKYTQGEQTPQISHATYKKTGKTYLVKGKYQDYRLDTKWHTYYYRIQRVSDRKIKISNGKHGKLLTMTRFKHAPKNSRTWW